MVEHAIPWGTVWQGAGGLSTTVSTSRTDLLAAQPGRVVAVEGPTGLGATRIGIRLLAPLAQQMSIAIVDVRGWICPLAVWEMGIPPDRLVTVRCDDPIRWPQALAALLEGINGIYAEIPAGVSDQTLRRLAALARARDVALVLRPLRGSVTNGIPYLRVRPTAVHWQGAERGHGRLNSRVVAVEVSGKGVSGMQRTIELEDDGTDIVHLVSGMAPAEARRAVG